MLYEFQKIITSIVIVILVVFGIGKISDIVFKTEENVVAYKVEVQTKEVSSAETVSLDMASFLSLGDVEHGKKVFKKCAACHSINKGGKNKISWSYRSYSLLHITKHREKKRFSIFRTVVNVAAEFEKIQTVPTLKSGINFNLSQKIEKVCNEYDSKCVRKVK